MVQSAASTVRFTYEDYCNLPDDGNQYEIIEGEIYMAPAPIPNHQRISRRILSSLDRFIEKHDMGEMFFSPIDIVFSNINVVQPDLIYISREKTHIIGSKFIEASPDLVIEILSPGTENKDRNHKQKLYGKFNVPEYWIVSPQGRTIEQYSLQEGKMTLRNVFTIQDVLTTKLLPGFELPVARVFEGIHETD